MSLRVLTYHRVATRHAYPGLSPRLISASPDCFERQMAFLARNYSVLDVGDVLAALQEGRPLPKRSVLLTFDDGYRDFAEVAWPIIRHYNLPVTLFVPTAFPGSSQQFWWDRLYHAFSNTKQEVLYHPRLGKLSLAGDAAVQQSLAAVHACKTRLHHSELMQMVDELCAASGVAQTLVPAVLNWRELRKLRREGVAIAAHTRTHADLVELDESAAREEILGSQADLVREFGSALPVFCYPGGRFNEQARAILRQAGCQLGFSTRDGQNDLNSPSTDDLALRRTNITPRTTFPIFCFRLLRATSYLDRWRHDFREWRETRAPLTAASGA